MLRFVLVTLRAAYPANMCCKLQFQISASLRSAKIRFLTTRPVRQSSNWVFCVSYATSRQTCRFELNAAMLDFDRFQVSKNTIFEDLSRRPQMVRLLLVTSRAAFSANLS